jgi:hypothetical protein
VVNLWNRTLVSTVISQDWPQYGHWIDSDNSMPKPKRDGPKGKTYLSLPPPCRHPLVQPAFLEQFFKFHQPELRIMETRFTLCLACTMRRFFSRNIGFQGRMARGVIGAITLIAGIILADVRLWLCLTLVGLGLFAIIEAVCRWSLARACGIRLKISTESRLR